MFTPLFLSPRFRTHLADQTNFGKWRDSVSAEASPPFSPQSLPAQDDFYQP